MNLQTGAEEVIRLLPEHHVQQIGLYENTWKNDNKKWHMKMIEHNHFICHLILGTFTEYPYLCFDRYAIVPPIISSNSLVMAC